MRTRRLLTALALAAFAPLGPLAALHDARAAEPPGRLVQPVAPRSYDLSIRPDADLARFKGRVEIELAVEAATTKVMLNASRLEIEATSVDGEAAAFSLDAAQDTMTVTAAKPMTPGLHRLAIEYRGVIAEQVEGLYRVDYDDERDGKTVRTPMLATQMEPVGARRLLPCFDEPRFRATFRITAEVPAGLVAVSNGEVASRTRLDDGTDRVVFEPSLPMASYLVALFVGPFEHIEEVHNGVTVRMFTMRGKAEQAREALRATETVLDFYDDYFGIPFALPKLDSVAVPGGFQGAMENWGAIAYNESTLLYDAQVDSATQRGDIWSIVAHETAHQWFGDLVTMRWWNDIWLNEGFASWIAAKAVDRFHPEWHHELDDMRRMSDARDDDALGVVGAIERPVADDRESLGAFDSIVYNKGQQLIGMIEAALGETALRDGLRRYMQQHRFGSATTDDLWHALEEGGGRSVAALADKWVREPGLPLITVARRCDAGIATATLSQSPFTFLPGAAPSAPTPWVVPVRVAYGANLETLRTVVVKGEPVTVGLPDCATPLLLNEGNGGHYRVQYDARGQQLLLEALAGRPDASRDRFGLMSNVFALYWSRRATLDDVSAVLRAFQSEPQPIYWSLASDAMRQVRVASIGAPHDETWRRVRGEWIAILRSADRAGAVAAADGDLKIQRLARREQIYRALGRLGDAPTVIDARIRYATDGGQQDGPAMAHAVLDVVAEHARGFEYDALLARWRRSNVQRERRWLYAALGSVDDPALARRSLDLMLDRTLPSFETLHMPRELALAGHEPMVWRFLDANWSKLAERAGDWLRSAMIADTARYSTDPARADEVEPAIVSRVGPWAAATGRRAAQWSRVLVQSQRNG